MSIATHLGRLLLVAALLAGGHAALVHPLQHVDDSGSLVHAAGDHDSGQAGGLLCDLIDAMTAVVGSAAACVAADAPVHGAVFALAQSARGSAPLAPSSRGPPTLL